jgi:hypothetical protein
MLDSAVDSASQNRQNAEAEDERFKKGSPQAPYKLGRDYGLDAPAATTQPELLSERDSAVAEPLCSVVASRPRHPALPHSGCERFKPTRTADLLGRPAKETHIKNGEVVPAARNHRLRACVTSMTLSTPSDRYGGRAAG